MHIIKCEPFEFGLDLENTSLSSVQVLFHALRECPDCSGDADAIDQLERQVLIKLLEREVE